MALQQPWLRFFGPALSSWSSHVPSSFLPPRSRSRRRSRPHPRHQTPVSVRASLHGSFASTSIETSSDFSSMVMFPSQQSSTLSCRTGERWVCFGGGKRLRKPRIWKTRQRRGTINKADKLLDIIQSVSNVKEEVYGALDSFVAWELEFPLIAVKKALRTLEVQGKWIRIIQISKWMLGKGQGRTLNTYSGLLKAFSEEGRIDEAQELYNKILMQNTKHTPLRIFRQILTMYRRYQMYEEIIDVFADLEELELKLDTEMVEIVSETYERLGMSDKAERVRLKYPAPVYRWRHSNDGSAKRVLVHRPFKAGVHNSSTRGRLQHDEIQHEHAIVDNNEEGLDVENEGDLSEDGDGSSEDEESSDYGGFNGESSDYGGFNGESSDYGGFNEESSDYGGFNEESSDYGGFNKESSNYGGFNELEFHGYNEELRQHQEAEHTTKAFQKFL